MSDWRYISPPTPDTLPPLSPPLSLCIGECVCVCMCMCVGVCVCTPPAAGGHFDGGLRRGSGGGVSGLSCSAHPIYRWRRRRVGYNITHTHTYTYSAGDCNPSSPQPVGEGLGGGARLPPPMSSGGW